jgi:hypothetical protein
MAPATLRRKLWSVDEDRLLAELMAGGRRAPEIARTLQPTTRALGAVLTHKAIQIAFPQRLWLAFSEWNLGEAHCNRRNKADRGPSLAPEGPLLGPEVQQSRDCEDARAYEQVEQANP